MSNISEEVRMHLGSIEALLDQMPDDPDYNWETTVSDLAGWFRRNKHRFPEDLFVECTEEVAHLTEDANVCFLTLCEFTQEECEKFPHTAENVKSTIN